MRDAIAGLEFPSLRTLLDIILHLFSRGPLLLYANFEPYIRQMACSSIAFSVLPGPSGTQIDEYISLLSIYTQGCRREPTHGGWVQSCFVPAMVASANGYLTDTLQTSLVVLCPSAGTSHTSPFSDLPAVNDSEDCPSTPETAQSFHRFWRRALLLYANARSHIRHRLSELPIAFLFSFHIHKVFDGCG